MIQTGLAFRSGQWYFQNIESGRLVDEVRIIRVQEDEPFDISWVGGPAPSALSEEGPCVMLRLPDTPIYFQRVPEEDESTLPEGWTLVRSVTSAILRSV